MIRPFPVSVAAIAAALACLAFAAGASAQGTSPNAVITSSSASTNASQVPPINIPPQVQTEVNHVRRLVREVRDNTDNIQSKGDFGAQLWLVQGQQFFDDWRKPGTPSIDPVTIVQRGQTISTVIIFYGTARDTKGLCNVHYNIVVKRPDGTIYDHRDDLVGWQDLAPASDRELMLGRDFVGINVGPEDPAGIYTVEASVRDNVGRADLSLKQTFVIQ